MSDDAQQINALLGSQDSPDLSYSESQLEYIENYNIGSYTDNNIRFDTLQITSKWADLHNGFLEIPITCSGTFGATPLLLLKGSILSIIKGIVVSTSNGQQIAVEDGNYFINNVRLLLDQSNDFKESNGSHLHFAKDRSLNSVRSTLTSAANIINPRSNMYTASPSGAANAINPNYNVGAAERNFALLDASVVDGAYGTTSLTAKVQIPLKFISSFFDALDFPIVNTRLQIQINTNTSSSGFLPVCCGTKLDNTVEGTPTVSITSGGVCRLYYRAIKYDPITAGIVAKKIASGFSKRLEYTVTDVMSNYTAIASTSSFSHQVASNVIKPVRVWALFPPTARVNTVDWPSPIVTGQHGLTNCQLLVNGTPYFSTTFTNLYQQWDALKAQMPPTLAGSDTSSILNFSDFVNTYRILCFDISRNKDRLIDPNAPVNLTLNANPISSTSCDAIYLIERKMVCILHMSSNEVRVEVGANLS